MSDNMRAILPPDCVSQVNVEKCHVQERTMHPVNDTNAFPEEVEVTYVCIT